MVVGRAGSAFAAELGTMRTTEQIDALSSMAVDPIQYLVVPRILATTLVLPMLAILFEFSGMVGAFVVATKHIGIDAGRLYGVREWVWQEDITTA
jgi:phospholipid/cholesterol/gamma-HCH transport system permease protein